MKEAVLENEGLLFRILDYCDHRDRSSVLFLSRTHVTLLSSEASFRWRLGRLHVERGLYSPVATTTHHHPGGGGWLDPPPPAAGRTWKSEFEDLWRRRRLWVGRGRRGSTSGGPPTLPRTRTGGRVRGTRMRGNGNEESAAAAGVGGREEEDTFRIRVCARLKPRGLAIARRPAGAAGSVVDGGSKKIALPLHQRLELIRMHRNLASRREALEVLRDQRGWFGGLDIDDAAGRDERGSGAEEEKKEEAVVWLTGKDPGPSLNSSPEAVTEDVTDRATAASSLRGGVHFVDKDDGRVVFVDPTKGLREFAFDAVDDGSSQAELYGVAALPLVGDVINGRNATCLVYGQTGSGKTHAMFGPPAPLAEGGDKSLGLDAGKRMEAWGIVPRACAQLFEALEYRRRSLNVDIVASVSISYVEVFGDEVVDLLRGGSKCGQSRVAAQRFVLDGSAEVPVESLDDAFRMLNAGEAQKRKAATAMNDRSSRAHAIFIATVRQKCTSSDVEMTSRLFLADLGGSEKAKKSQRLAALPGMNANGDGEEAAAAARAKNEERLREAAKINLGLLALKRCVEALVRSQRKNNRSHVHVPYSENKLTMLLSSGLGGNSNTCVIVCAAQEEEHGSETVAALRFGQVCGGVSKTLTSSDEEGGALRELLSRIDASISRCEDKIRKHERWETRRETRVDERAEGGGDQVEFVMTTVLVGAERYRLELEELLRKRAELVS